MTSEGRAESLQARNTPVTAEWVKGEVIVRSDSLVTCALRVADEAERRGRAWASWEEGWSMRADDETVSWNWSIRARVVDRRVASCLDILRRCGAATMVVSRVEELGEILGAEA